MKDSMSSLVLGTVQLGMPYGVANKTGQPDQQTATEIIRAAWEGGISEFDTAQDYGQSEAVLGFAFQELGIADKVRVITKLSKNVDVQDETAVVEAVQKSIERLKVPALHAVLLHKKGEMGRLHSIVKNDLAKHIGMSVYVPESAIEALETDGVSVLQVPSNMLDRRFERAGVFERAKDSDVEIFVRSVFLQGLLLIDSKKMPLHMEFARSMVERIEKLAQQMNVTREVLALQYVKTAFPNAHVIVGAETAKQIRENVAAWNALTPKGILERVREECSAVDEHILDPRKWAIGHLQHLVTTEHPEKADAIVWLQGNGYDRGAKVLELYRGGYAPVVLVTGNTTRVVDDDHVKVSDIVEWLLAHGVDKEVIIVDDQSINTLEQARYVVAKAKKDGWRAILLVGSTHHQLRAFLTFLHQSQIQGWNGHIINQPFHVGWNIKPSGRRKTTQEAFKDEIEKLELYKENVATIETGLQSILS